MENKIIYVVTDGEYSDFHIEGVYESKELAEEVHGVGCDIGEWNLNTDINERRQGLKRFNVMMLRDGSIHQVRDYWRNNREPLDHKPADYFQFDKKVTLSIADFEMWAKDETHAIKIANERRVQLIASNQWVE